MSTLYLVRGVPGSGKSTWAKAQAEAKGVNFYEADQWMLNDKGEYQFDFNKLKWAHNCCFESAMADLKHKDVYVSNTFTQDWEMEKYIRRALTLGHKVVLVQMTKEYGSVHGVPEKKMKEMRERFHENDMLESMWLDPRVKFEKV